MVLNCFEIVEQENAAHGHDPARLDAIMQENFGSDRQNIDEVDMFAVLFSQVFGFDKEV